VDVEIICTSSVGDEEITWEIKQDDTVLISGLGGETKSACLPYGMLTLVGKDSYGDGWTGATIKVVGQDGTIYLPEWSGPATSEESKTFYTKLGACPIGSYGMINCTNCSIGKFGNEAGKIDEASACPFNISTCPVGHFCQDRIANACPKGTFNNVTGQTGQTSCKSCLDGYVALSEGSASCSTCSKGAYCPNGTSQIQCPKGTFNDVTGQSGQTSCKSCLDGYVALSEGSASCSTCSKGAYCPNGTSQIQCPKGTFNDVTGQSGQTSCKSCLDGYVALSEGSASCSTCSKGAYCPNGSQIQCPKGTFNGLEGQTSENSCKVCTAGTFLTCNSSYKFELACYGGHDGICYRCHDQCHKCDTDGETCLECQHNMYLYNNTCVDQCPENYVAKHYWRTVGNICELPLPYGILVAWGDPSTGGTVPPEITSLKNIKTIFSTGFAFAALTNENSVVAWGSSASGGTVPPEITSLKNIKTIFSTRDAFAALTNENSVVAWGDSAFGGTVPPEIASLKNIKTIFSSYEAFAALTNENSVVAWGDSASGGTVPPEITSLKNIKTIFSTGFAFAALTNENSVVAWGPSFSGGNVPPEITSLKNIKTIFSNARAFAALTNENSVVAWGDSASGGTVPPEITSLKNIKTIFSNYDAFAALTNENSVVAWGPSFSGGTVPPEITSLKNIKTIFSNYDAFAALTNENSVVAWGPSFSGGNVPPEIASLKNIKSSYVPPEITSLKNIKTIFSTRDAFAALTNENSVVAWGPSFSGGATIPAVSSQSIPQNVHQIIASSFGAFVAIKSCNNELYADPNQVCTQCENGYSTHGNINNIGKDSCKPCQQGKSRNNDLSQLQCQHCQNGFYQNENASKNCDKVGPGNYLINCYNSKLQLGCSNSRVCDRGYYCMNGEKKLCKPGTFASEEGSSRCTRCERGTFTNKTGQILCDNCPVGTYQDTAGQTKCIPCPIDTFSPTTGNTAPAQCLKCTTDFALHTTTNYSVGVANASGCVCQGIDTTIEGNVGYYTNPTPTNKEDFCLRCPNGALCSNPNTKIATLGTKPGYWRSSTESNVFHECLNDIDCPGNLKQSLQCRQGNTGVICAVCAENHVRFNDGLCTKCDEGANAIGLPLMIFIFGLVYVGVLVRYMIKVKKASAKMTTTLLVIGAVAKMKRRARQRAKRTSNSDLSRNSYRANNNGNVNTETLVIGNQTLNEANRQRVATASEDSEKDDVLLKIGSPMRILFGFMQVNAALNITFDVPWSPAFLAFIDFAKLVNIDFMWITSSFSPCSFNASYLDVFYLHMWILPILLAFTLIATGFAYCFVRWNNSDHAMDKKEKMIELAIRVMNVTIFLLYPGIGTRIFRLFKCRRIGEFEYLMADYSIVCWEKDHNYAVAVAVFCIFLYVIGIPLLCIFILYKRKLNLDNAKTKAVFGSLYLAYERKYWYWESIEMLKKIILAGGLVIVTVGSSPQVLLGTMVAFVYLLMVVRFEPYEDILDDYLQIGASIQMVLNLIIGLVLQLDDKGVYDVHVLGIFLLIMNLTVVFFAIILACLAFPKVRACCSKKRKTKTDKKTEDIEMVNIINPMHTKKKKSEVVVEVQPKKKPPRRSIATEERMKRIRRLSANRRPSASVLNALNLKELEVDKTAYI